MNTAVLLFAVDIALKATVLFAVTGAVLFALRRAPAAARHRVGSAALAAALALPLLSIVLPSVALPLLPRPLVEKPRALRVRTIEDTGSRFRLAISEPEGAVPSVPAPAAPAVAPKAPARRAAPVFPRVNWLAVALTAWAAGTLLIAARLAVGWARVRRIAREAEPIADPEWHRERDALAARLNVRRRPELLESEEVPVAMTSGLLRPLLLLGRAARAWAVERRRVVLLHELAHIKRGDWLAVLVAEAAVALYWFHPAAWLLARQVRRDGEKASDELVLAAGTKPSVYAGHLLGIFRALTTIAHPVAPALAIARPSHFEARLRAILDPQATRRELARGRAALSVLGVLAAALLVAVVEPWAAGGAAILQADRDEITSLAAHTKTKTSSCTKTELRIREKTSTSTATTVRTSAHPRPETAIDPTPEPSVPMPESGRSLPAVLNVLPGIMRDAAPGFVRTGKGWKNEKHSSGDWYGRGMELHRDERYDEAIEAFQKSIDAGYKEGASTYNIACGYALKGDKDKAFEWLHKAMEVGFDISGYLGHDDDLDSLESDPRWKDLKKAARAHRSTKEQDKARSTAARYERLTANGSASGESYFEIGRELLNAERFDLSAKAFQAAADRGYRVGTSLYNEACALSRGGDKRGALDLLGRALDEGFDQPDRFKDDDDLDNVRDEPRFAELAKEAKALSLPGYGIGRWAFGDSWGRSKWREAARKFEEYTRQHPQKGRGWFNLGYAQLAGERPEAAAEAFQKALDLKYRKPTTLYNLACSYARMDQKDKAFDWLFKALDAGFDGAGQIRSDDDLDNLRGDPRYRKAIEIARAREKADGD